MSRRLPTLIHGPWPGQGCPWQWPGVGRSNSALGAALTQAGVPEDQIVQQLTVPKVDKCLLDVPGSAEDQGKARSLLARAKPAVAA